jgi:hypothetical protein
MKRYLCAFSLSLLVLSGVHLAGQTRRALIVGINIYQPAGTQAQAPAGCTEGRCAQLTYKNLDGSVNDAQAIADLLTSPKFGFPVDKVALLTNPAPPKPRPGVVILPADQTTRDGILAAMQKYLVDLPQRGDTVVFYDASHGSLRVNSKGTKMEVLVNGTPVHADSTLVPSDAYKGGFDVRDREMTRIFNAALDKGVHLTVIFDSCHSGGATRGLAPTYTQRTLPFDSRDINEAPELLPNGQPKVAPTDRTDNPALVFSAAQQDQSANEMPPSDAMPEPHGAFTAALISALQVLPANTPASIVYQRVRAVLEGTGVTDQDPDLDAAPARRQQPLFGGEAAASGKVLTAALKTDDEGKVWLDIGRVSGVGPGSEFTSTLANGNGGAVTLRVAELQGIARSTATVVSPANAKVAPGEIFELTKLIPAETDPLLFWHWPSTLSEDEITTAAAEVKAAGVVSVTDPAEQPWNAILSWDGTNWTLQQVKAASGAKIDLSAKPTPPASLGPKLTADALKKHLGAGAKLWVNLPPPRELSEKITFNDPSSVIRDAKDMSSANYILTGILTEDGPAYLWFNKSEFAKGPRASETHDHSPGCSTTSQYPVRTDWTVLGGPSQIDLVGENLSTYAMRLGKLHGWFSLSGSANGASAESYYKLVLAHAQDGKPLASDQPIKQDDHLLLELQADDPVSQPRWVYVLDIDCHGGGSLVYGDKRFPTEGANDRKFVLGNPNGHKVKEPFGVETLILLSTKEPLPQGGAVLNFEGTTTRGGTGSRDVESPLARLLSGASSGTRGLADDPVPTDWGLDITRFQTAPADKPKQTP